MRLTKAAVAGFGLMMAAMVPSHVAAEARIFPYGNGPNYCPAGYQPVSVGGVICCGQPNQSISYSQAMAHPVQKRRVVKQQRRVVYSAKAHCPAGTKGCSYD